MTDLAKRDAGDSPRTLVANPGLPDRLFLARARSSGAFVLLVMLGVGGYLAVRSSAALRTAGLSFLAEHGAPGGIVEHGPTGAMFTTPVDPRTNDYVNGRFG